MILVVCAIVMVAVSYLTKAPDYEKISGLTYGTITDEQRLATRTSWALRDVLASLIVLGAIVAAYLYFTG